MGRTFIAILRKPQRAKTEASWGVAGQ